MREASQVATKMFTLLKQRHNSDVVELSIVKNQKKKSAWIMALFFIGLGIFLAALFLLVRDVSLNQSSSSSRSPWIAGFPFIFAGILGIIVLMNSMSMRKEGILLFKGLGGLPATLW